MNWESGCTPDEAALRRLTEIDRLRSRLGQVMKPEFIHEWLSTPNEAFDGLKPLEVIERGEIDRLWDMLFYLESGVLRFLFPTEAPTTALADTTGTTSTRRPV